MLTNLYVEAGNSETFSLSSKIFDIVDIILGMEDFCLMKEYQEFDKTAAPNFLQ